METQQTTISDRNRTINKTTPPPAQSTKFMFEVFVKIDEKNQLEPEQRNDRITLEGIPKGKRCRIMVQVIDEQ